MDTVTRILQYDFGIRHRSEFHRLMFTAMLITLATWLTELL